MNSEKFLGCILGVAIGDALGLPFETMSCQEIREQGFSDINEYFPVSINSHAFSSVKNLKPGDWSDDTQLTLVTIDSIIEAKGFDMDMVAKKHVEILPQMVCGGKSTRNACKRLTKGVSWRESGEPGGGGNGVMMKIAPLGLMQSIVQKDEKEFIDECIDFGRMTHLVTPAIVAGCVHAFAIDFLARKKYEEIDWKSFLEMLRDKAIKAESRLPHCEDQISDRIRLMIAMGRIIQEANLKYLSDNFGGHKNFSAFDSFGISYAVFLRNPDSFDCVKEAILAGGDTDSNASIVGSLLGALHGSDVLPGSLLVGLGHSDMIMDRISEFYKEVCKCR